MRLVNWKEVQWQNRAHFFGTAAQIMRRVLVDMARTRGREKRGGGQVHVSLSEAEQQPAAQRADLMALDDAMKALEASRSTEEPGRRAALLRRPQSRGGGAGAGRLGRHGAARLEPRPRLAVSRAEPGMTAREFREVERLYHAALERPASERQRVSRRRLRRRRDPAARSQLAPGRQRRGRRLHRRPGGRRRRLDRQRPTMSRS